LNHKKERVLGYFIFSFRKNRAFPHTGREEKFRLKSPGFPDYFFSQLPAEFELFYQAEKRAF